MSHKISTARRAAFFKALRETGNQTLAAEAAKVSRSWVSLHRASDPDFRGEMEAAIAEAKARLSAHPARRPPSGWGFLDGEELVVRGGNRRRVQVARARLRQITPRTEERFLAVLAATCNVKAACAAAGVSLGAIYAHRRRWQAFAQRWDAAVEAGYVTLEAALIEAASNLFSGTGQPGPATITGMTAEQAIHLLHMHKHQARGHGRAPGAPRLTATVEELDRALRRAMDGLERSRGLEAKARARAERSYARRRPDAAGSRGEGA